MFEGREKKNHLPSCALSSRSVWLPRNWKRWWKLGRWGRARTGILYRPRSWLRDRGPPRTRCKIRSPPPARNFPSRTMAAKRGIARISRQRTPVWPRVYRKQTVSTILKRSVKRVFICNLFIFILLSFIVRQTLCTTALRFDSSFPSVWKIYDGDRLQDLFRPLIIVTRPLKTESFIIGYHWDIITRMIQPILDLFNIFFFFFFFFFCVSKISNRSHSIIRRNGKGKKGNKLQSRFAFILLLIPNLRDFALLKKLIFWSLPLPSFFRARVFSLRIIS